MGLAALEIHYYDGGLRSDTFPERRRPLSLPPIEAVALEDTRALSRNEILFEASVIDSATGERFFWIGCFLPSTDRQFGDRANYVCVGLWVSDLIVIECRELLMSLHRAATALQKSGLSNALESNLHDLTSVIAESYMKPRDDFPPSCTGISSLKIDPRSVKEYQIRTSFDSVVEFLASALINLQLAQRSMFNACRVIFRVNPDLPAAVPVSELPSASDLLVPLIIGIPDATAGSAKQLVDAKQRVAELSADNTRLATQVQSLDQSNQRNTVEREALRKQLLDQAEELEKLRKLPYTIINTQLRDLATRVEQISASMRGPVSYNPPTTRPLPKPNNSHDDSLSLVLSILKWFLYISVAGLLIGVGVYFGLKRFW
jgi:hypothetical protein